MCIIEHIENHETIETSSYIAYFTATRQEVFSLQHMRKQKKKAGKQRASPSKRGQLNAGVARQG
jgi:hypothetical protein